jgi:agmatine/peptidylarginine deiminase
MKRTLTFVCIFYSAAMLAQIHHHQIDLPRNLTDQEKWQMQFQADPPPPSANVITTPPTSPVRAMAEWEELQALVITWRSYPKILTEIVRAARLECKVIICCNDQAAVVIAQDSLTNAGVDFSSNVEFVVIPNNSIWVRDYGPNCVYKNDVDSLYIIDWIYNRTTRPLDNTLPEKLALHMQIPIYGTSAQPYQFVNTGGNFMSDGLGTSFSSKLVLTENLPGNQYGTAGQTAAGIDNILSGFMGINRPIRMQTLPYDVIHHIDMHMKLLDEQTLLVGKYPDGIADGPQIEANIQYVLNNYHSVFGTPYKVVRIPMPPDGSNQYPNVNNADYRTYANAVFVNKTVILPFYEQKYDTTAVRIWKDALPGYKVVGIDCNDIIPSLGAIHCITKEIGVPDPLHVVHQPLECQDNQSDPNGYPVWTTLQHRSGIASAKVFYTTALNLPWQSVEMQPYPDSVNVWRTTIPTQTTASNVYYYIQATSNSGKTVVHPLPAPEGYWKFCINTVATHTPVSANLSDIYPNPASAITCIPVTASEKTRAVIAVYNLLGQYMETIFEGDIPSGQSNYFLDAATYAPGTYMVKFQTPGSVQVRKVVVK